MHREIDGNRWSVRDSGHIKTQLVQYLDEGRRLQEVWGPFGGRIGEQDGSDSMVSSIMLEEGKEGLISSPLLGLGKYASVKLEVGEDDRRAVFDDLHNVRPLLTRDASKLSTRYVIPFPKING